MTSVDPPKRHAFQQRLLRWYAQNGRDLPWRHTRDPYQVLVSEMMLQQTQVDRVKPKYAQWLEHYPTLHDVAAAAPEEVKAAWWPLGYYRRAEHLHQMLKDVAERYGGKIPHTAELDQFKGIGRYTANALRCFAFGQQVPVLDTNVARVLSRVFVGSKAPKVKPSRPLWELAEQSLPSRQVYDYNQALMDLGALVCTARQPQCQRCPVKSLCRYFAQVKGSRPKDTRGSRGKRSTSGAGHGTPAAHARSKRGTRKSTAP